MAEIEDAAVEVARVTQSDKQEVKSHIMDMIAFGVPLEDAKASAERKFLGDNDG